MKVYIITLTYNQEPPDNWNIIGVYTNKAKARQILNDLISEYINDESRFYNVIEKELE